MNHLPRPRFALAVLLLAGGLRTAVAAEEASDASPPRSAAEQPVLPGPSLGSDGPGTELYRHITALELGRILDRHRKWLATMGGEGQRADLAGVRLDDADLDGADLRYAVMNRACLCRARLRNANLSGAELA